MKDVLSLLDNCDLNRFKDLEYWKDWAYTTGRKGIDMSDKAGARRTFIDGCATAAEEHDNLWPTVCLAAGFDRNGAMVLLYVSKTSSHLRRTCDHYVRILDETPATQEKTLLYSKERTAPHSSFFQLWQT